MTDTSPEAVEQIAQAYDDPKDTDPLYLPNLTAATLRAQADRIAELEAEVVLMRRAMAQMREDFRRIEMLAGQHCPADNSRRPVGETP